MKKNILSILVIFIFILNINAIKYDESISLTNDYAMQIKDRKYYLMNSGSVPYGYNVDGVYLESKFIDGGYLNLLEFQISQDMNGNTYLFNGRDYFTMTEVEDKVYEIKLNSNKFGLITKNNDSNIRITEFIRPKTRVVGAGTYSDPWKFIKNTFFVNVMIDDHACIDNICPLKSIEIEVEPDHDASVSIIADRGYAFDSAVCTNGEKFTYEYKEVNNKTFFTVKNVNEDTDCSLSFVKVDDKNIAYKESEQSFNILYPGYYKIEAYGAQGNNGSNGGKTSGIFYFDKGDKLSIITGGTNGYNGGGAGHYNGGGATHVKNENKYIMIAAGGGGGKNATAGGSGTGAGGASTNNGKTAYNVPSGYKNGQAGTRGLNGGGGGSSYIYYYGDNCDDCYTGKNTCKYGCDRCRAGQSCTTKCAKKCLVDRNLCTWNPPAESCYYCCSTYEDCKTIYKDCNCSSCHSGSNTCKWGCDSKTKSYNPGNGGSNEIISTRWISKSESGINEGNGKVNIIYYNEKEDSSILKEVSQ